MYHEDTFEMGKEKKIFFKLIFLIYIRNIYIMCLFLKKNKLIRRLLLVIIHMGLTWNDMKNFV